MLGAFKKIYIAMCNKKWETRKAWGKMQIRQRWDPLEKSVTRLSRQLD